MKRLFFLLTITAGLFVSCQNNAPADAAKTSDNTEAATEASAAALVYTINTDASVINWEGYKPGKYSHIGTIKLQSGQFAIKDGAPESGSFVIDMNSLDETTIEDPAKKAKLEGHLKSGDFFEVEKYPTGAFEITGVAPLEGNADANFTLTGNLTLKGITKSIEIPAKVTVGEGEVTVSTPEFTINRTEWGIVYDSGTIGTLKDKLIADDVKLKITLVGNVQVADAE